MTAPEEHLAPIREREQAATKGPWKAQEYVDIDEDGSYELANVVAPDPDAPDVSVLGVAPGILRNDAEFIAHAREDVPRLLAALDGVLALHKSVIVYEIDPMNGTWIYGDDDERKVMTVLCSECTPDHILSEAEDCEYDGPNDVDVCWPCPTITAITTALDGQA